MGLVRNAKVLPVMKGAWPILLFLPLGLVGSCSEPDADHDLVGVGGTGTTGGGAPGGAGGLGGATSSTGTGGSSAGRPACPTPCEGCFAYSPPPLLDTTDESIAAPEVRRALGAKTYTLGGVPYLLYNEGNQLRAVTLVAPTAPSSGSYSGFPLLVSGDRDHNLFGDGTCDECELG